MRSKTVIGVARRSLLHGGLCLSLLFSWATLGCGDKASSGPTTKGSPASAGKDRGPRRGEGESAPVSVVTVTRMDVPVEIKAVGNVEAYLKVTIKAQVSGILTGVHFREGDFVKKNDLLFEIDPRQLEAQLNQAQANLAKDTAQLGQAEATLTKDLAEEKYSRAQAARYSNLLEHRLISKEQAEQMRANADAAHAAVLEDEAAITSARATVSASKAAIENIRVQLGYTSIQSPITGRTGYLNVDQGNVIGANSTDLVTINQIEPIYVVFSLPQARMPEIKLNQPVAAASPDNPAAAETGKLTFIDNTVDASTGAIRLKATFPNSSRRLWPGELVRVTIRVGNQSKALVVPSQAVQTSQEGTFVFVVKPDRTVEARPVATGIRYDQQLVIEKGLEAGEVVVTEGQLRLAPGVRVQITKAAESASGRASKSPEP